MPLTQARKDAIASMEFGALIQQTASVRGYEYARHSYRKELVDIYVATDDGHGKQKKGAVIEAVKRIVDKGIRLPKGLKVYCSGAWVSQNRAFHRDVNWDQIAVVVLGSKACRGGRSNANSAILPPLYKKLDAPTVTCIHEIGHILHGINVGDAFFDHTDSRAWTKPPKNADGVSGYAQANKKEFVAEVFAGLVLGQGYSEDCMKEYEALGGPSVPRS